jgi:threonine/homoserine/homoserine lactone efflux protein
MVLGFASFDSMASVPAEGTSHLRGDADFLESPYPREGNLVSFDDESPVAFGPVRVPAPVCVPVPVAEAAWIHSLPSCFDSPIALKEADPSTTGTWKMPTEPLSSLAAGIVLGLSAGFAPGPLLTLVITQTLRHNMREGVKVAMAPLITDVPIILATLFLLVRLSDFDRLLGLISLVGAGYVLYLAYESIRTGPVTLEEPEDQPRSIRKGAIINALNPHPYLFWATVGAPFLLRTGQEGLTAPVLFLLGFYLFLVGSKVVLAILVGKSRAFLTRKAYLWTMRFLGCLLGAFAVLLLKEAFSLLRIVGEQFTS